MSDEVKLREMLNMKLLIPGPVEVSSEVLLSVAKPLMGHRTPDFEEILMSCIEDLKYVFQTKNDVVIITGSGTSAMDAAIASTVREGDEVVCIGGGKFGERFAEIAKSYGAKVIEFNVEWGSTFDKEKLEETVANSNAKVITLTHNETSTGVLHDASFVGKLAREYDMLFIMDGITSVGGDIVKTDEWGVDICITGSQKCIAAPPGLAMLSISKKALDVINNNEPRAYYLNLQKYKKSIEKRTTPFTPSVTLIYGLYQALKEIRKEGLEKRIKRHRTLAKATREAVKALGLELFPKEEIASNTITAIKIPPNLTDADIRGKLKSKFGILVAGGQAKLKGKIFRIGHMGNIRYADLVGVIGALELVLKEANFNIELGSGLKALQEVFEKEGV